MNLDRINGNLVGEIVTLKILDKSYFQDYSKMFSETVKKFLHVQHDESEIKYLETRLENKSFFYCIFLNSENKLVGAIEIRELTESDGQLYSWVNENYWGSGAYQEALNLISRKYFEVNPECKYYTANVDAENLRSYYALKKYGFIDSGIKNGPYGLQYKLLLVKK